MDLGLDDGATTAPSHSQHPVHGTGIHFSSNRSFRERLTNPICSLIIPNMKVKNNKRTIVDFHVRVERELAEELERLAKKERRSLSAQASHILSVHLLSLALREAGK